MNIRAYINPNKGICFHSDMFRAKFVNNKNLHPSVENIKMEVFSYTAGKPAIYIYDREHDHKVLYKQEGHSMDMKKIEEILMHRLGVEC